MIEMPKQTVVIDYTNYKNERKIRTVIPHSIIFSESVWHPELQWILIAFDVEKDALRQFAMKNIHHWKWDQPVRELTQEEYEAKVAAGKKVTFSKGGKY